MTRKKVNFNGNGISKLPTNKPVLYKIKTANGTLNYAGISKKGEAQERISDHLGKIPGSTVEIEQFGSIQEARNKEINVIKRNQPKYNKQDK